jgi:hypothetical protein
METKKILIIAAASVAVLAILYSLARAKEAFYPLDEQERAAAEAATYEEQFAEPRFVLMEAAPASQAADAVLAPEPISPSEPEIHSFATV